MNILYLINYAGKAGTEKYVLNLMHILSAQGETCHLAYNVPGQLSETVSSEGFACFRFEMSTKKALSAAKKLAGYCRENKIDVIHAQYPMENVIAILSRLFYRKVKVVYTSHLTIYQNTKWKILNRLFTPFDHRIIAVCRQGADIMISNGVKKDRIQVVYNGVEPKRERVYDRSFAREFGVNDDTFVMSIMARYAPEKGLPFLLASLAKLRRKTDKPFVCFIAGDGEERESLSELHKQLGLRNTFFLGNQKQDELRRLYNAADVFVMPSRREPFGLVALEAMACGLPVVGSNEGGLPEFINSQVGTLVSPEDEEAFCAAILNELTRHHTEPERRDIIAHYASSNFAQAQFVEKLEQVYQRAVRDFSG